MDNRTIRRAITRRVPEVYYIAQPHKEDKLVKWAMLANINARPYWIVADMPDTALISHNELLTTMVSEVYDQVRKIEKGSINPEIPDHEKGLTPLGDDARKLMEMHKRDDLIKDHKRLVI